MEVGREGSGIGKGSGGEREGKWREVRGKRKRGV